MSDAPVYVEEIEGTEFPVLPAGSYFAELMKLERIQTKFGEALKWHWRAERPGQEDFLLSDITSNLFTPKSRANEIVKALRGSVLARGERLNLANLARRAQLFVSINEETGFNVVDKVLPAPSGQQPKTAPEQPDAEFLEWQAWKAAQGTGNGNGTERPSPVEPTPVDEVVGA